LIDKTQQIQICDFGFGNIIQQQHQVLNTYCGSPFYAAPEMVTATPYRGPPVDLWSCGVILYTMLTGSLPFQSNDMPRLFQKISHGQFAMPTNITNEAADLIHRLLCKDPKDRITASECLLHPWFSVSDLSLPSKPQVVPKKEVEKKKSLFMRIFKKKSQVAPLDANEKSALMKVHLLNQVKGFFRPFNLKRK
jgi:serine/threonine protein kinase